MASKHWSYEQITAEAEARIQRYMQQAMDSAHPRDESQYSAWAFGVYAMWNGLTHGEQQAGDDERLLVLTQVSRCRYE